MNRLPLPESWVEVDICEINHHKSKSINPAQYPDETFELYSVPTFPTGKPEYLTGAEIGSSKQEVEPGDVLLCKINPRINRVWFVSKKGKYRQIASSEWIVVRQPLISSSFLRAYFSEYNFRQLLCSEVTGVGGSLTRAQPKKVAVYPVRFPSENEQARIANKLDELLAQVDTIKARVDAIPAILKRFRQSVLAAAVSGKLTEEFRGSQSICAGQSPVTIGRESEEVPEGWEWKKISDLAELESGHTPRKSVPEYWEGGDVYWISLQDIRAAHGTIIEDTKFKPTMLGIENSSARLLPEGTVCFSRDISVGFTTIMGKSMSTTQHFANWVCGEGLVNKYLMYALMAAKDHLTVSGQGSTVKTIYMPALKEFFLLTPSVDEQHRIVSEIERYYSFVKQLEVRISDAQTRVYNLAQSTLAKAFRGELVSQDPNDEPASELLARIQKARDDVGQLSKAAKNVARKPHKKGTAKG